MKTLLGAVVLIALSGSTAARAETYNFYFDSTKVDLATSAASEKSEQARVESNFERAHRWSADVGAFYGGRGSDSLAGGGLMVGAAFAARDWLKFHSYLGHAVLGGQSAERKTFGGLEGELLPLHYMVDLGAVAGLSNFEKVGDNFASVHVGLIATARMNRFWSLTGAVRANLGSVLVNTGVAFRL